MTCESIERDLDAYVDRELDATSDAAVREHLAACASCRARVGERQALGRLVRATPYHQAPPRLRMAVSQRAGRSHAMRRLAAWATAAVLVTATAAGIVLLRSGSARGDGPVEEAVSAHVRSLMDDHLFDVRSTDQHTVKPWFLGKLDFSPPVTDLAPVGFPLVGGRLDYLAGRPVAALVYQRRQHTINLFVAPDRATGAFPSGARSVRGFHVHAWTRDGMDFWAVSDVNDTELSEFVRALDR